MRFCSVIVLVVAPALAGCGCASVAPPASRFPDADAALGRMRATYACGNAIKAVDAKLDRFADHQRIRGELSFFVARPDRIRMDVFAPPPVSSAIATLTTDGNRFALMDLRERRFFVGPASACNIQRLTKVPVPGHVMVDLLRGEAPVLRHDPAATTIAWDSSGYYVLKIPSTRDASEEIHLTPHPDDFAKPWGEQRIRVLDVAVRQQGFVLYHAEFDDHKVPPMDKPLEAEIPGEDVAVPLSGPVCAAEVPHKIHVDIPVQGEDVQFRYEKVWWNPPLPEGKFLQPVPPGMQPERVSCD